MFNGEIMKVVIDLPQNIKLPLNEVEKRVKVELALTLYKKGILSFGQARKLAEFKMGVYRVVRKRRYQNCL